MSPVDFWKLDPRTGAPTTEPIVVFEHGTCVGLPRQLSIGEQAALALAHLKEHGEVRPGSPSADVCILKARSGAGWVGLYECGGSQLMNFVSADVIPLEDDRKFDAMMALRAAKVADHANPKIVFQQ